MSLTLAYHDTSLQTGFPAYGPFEKSGDVGFSAAVAGQADITRQAA